MTELLHSLLENLTMWNRDRTEELEKAWLFLFLEHVVPLLLTPWQSLVHGGEEEMAGEFGGGIAIICQECENERQRDAAPVLHGYRPNRD